jgi:uncharacterized protein (UPF0332 family)
MVAIQLAPVAARCAYYTAFHSAEALIFERTGRVAKTHSGVRSEFARLIRDEPRIAPDARAFLARAYQFKEVSDYGLDPDQGVTMEQAGWAIQSASELIGDVQGILD